MCTSVPGAYTTKTCTKTRATFGDLGCVTMSGCGMRIGHVNNAVRDDVPNFNDATQSVIVNVDACPRWPDLLSGQPGRLRGISKRCPAWVY